MPFKFKFLSYFSKKFEFSVSGNFTALDTYNVHLGVKNSQNF